MEFRDKVVLVTGSSKGLGKSIAIGFADKGANVVINYNSSESEALVVEDEIKSKSVSCLRIKADVSKAKEVKKMFNEIISVYGKIDILVNNAGIYEDSVVWKMDEEKWDKVIDTDLKSVFLCTKYATANMRAETYGKILNISSVVGQTGAFGTSNYSAAKAGIIGFTKSVAIEVASKNITINTLSLGFIEEGMLLRLPDKIKSSILKRILLNRWGRPDEVVKTALFLCSDSASYITGQTINLNGGYFLD